MVLTRKRLLLIGFIVVLLIGIPLTLFIVQQQSDLRSRAEKSTTLYYEPSSSEARPLEKKIDEKFTLDLFANPGNNLISSVRVIIEYDPTKLATASAQGEESFVPDTKSLPEIMFGPVYTPGKIAVTLSSGGDPTGVVSTVSKIGTVTLVPVGETGASPTKVSYGIQTLVTSAGNQGTTQKDQYAENVLSAANPAFIQVLGDAAPTATPTPSLSMTPTPIATATPTPIVISGPPGPQGPQGPQGPAGETVIATPTLSEEVATPTAALDTPTASPTMEPTGPGDTILGFGFVVTVLTIIGGLLFFTL